VVLVDDLSYVREALAELLRTAGYDVVPVASGQDALALLQRAGADLVLTDLYMPDMSGWDLVREIRARSVTNSRGLPLCVGLYSAVLSGFSREQLARAQVDFAVTKLSDPEAMLQAVERALAWAVVRCATHDRSPRAERAAERSERGVRAPASFARRGRGVEPLA
jgi:CheY-like chemotaxis protein